MHRALAGFARVYGARPLHLLTLVAGLALCGYVVAVAGPGTLWNSHVWWQSIIVWFAAAVVAHDLVLFPAYALLDRLVSPRWAPRARPAVPVVNYVRTPALGSALALLVFLPGIVRQGSITYHAATGQTQDPFLGRWLLLTAGMFSASAAIYAARVAVARWRRPGKPGKSVQ